MMSVVGPLTGFKVASPERAFSDAANRPPGAPERSGKHLLPDTEGLRSARSPGDRFCRPPYGHPRAACLNLGRWAWPPSWDRCLS